MSVQPAASWKLMAKSTPSGESSEASFHTMRESVNMKAMPDKDAQRGERGCWGLGFVRRAERESERIRK